MISDLDLIGQFIREHSQRAFEELVRRHLNLVYSVALRQTRSPQLAEEVSQSVFADLARDARRLTPGTALAAWLYQVAHRTAIDLVRRESRRQARERAAVELTAMNATASNWTDIEPLLDDAMESLDDADRAAILLRYFENKSLREVGAELGVSDDAAQKRVSRAVERLREFFSKRNVTIGASGLAVLISANAVQSAPAALLASISAGVIAGTAAPTSTAIALTKTIAMTTLQKTFLATTVTVLAGAGIYEARNAARLRDQVQTLQRQQAPLVEQIARLQSNFADATNRLADLGAENSRLKGTPHQTELLKLRGEMAHLRNDTDQANDPIVKQALRWKANVAKMRELFAEYPEQQIPELKLLSDQYFFDLARDQDLESSNGIRKAFSEIRTRAENEFANRLQPALQEFVQMNSNQPPSTVLALAPLFDPPVDKAILEHYHLINTGQSVVGGWNGGWAISQKDTPDLDYDRQWFISPVGFSSAPYKPPEKY